MQSKTSVSKAIQDTIDVVGLQGRINYALMVKVGISYEELPTDKNYKMVFVDGVFVGIEMGKVFIEAGDLL